MQSFLNLTENFILLNDWEDRYKYLIELGDSLPPMQESLKISENEVNGCVSRVWLTVNKQQNGQYFYSASSDGAIARGLIYIVLAAYSGLTAIQSLDVNIDTAFAKMGLSEHLTPNRRSGFYAMVERIKVLSTY